MAVVNLSDTADQTLDIIQAFNAAKMPLSEAQAHTSDLLERAIVHIEDNPLLYPIMPEALMYGVNLHRWIDPDTQHVCLYEYDKTSDSAMLHLFAHTKQDYLSLLYMVQISR